VPDQFVSPVKGSGEGTQYRTVRYTGGYAIPEGTNYIPVNTDFPAL